MANRAASLVSSVLVAVALVLSPLRVTWAAPAPTEKPAEPSAPATESSASGAVKGTEPGAKQPGSASAANETGDLTAAREQAVTSRKADPTPENWRREAEVMERSGNYGAAIAAYQGLLEALPADAQADRADAQARIETLQDAQRGKVADEPTSTHRKQLDARWAPPPPVVPDTAPAPAPPAEKKDRIVTKWYFWVTLTAIVASAAAITAIAIKASTEDDNDALSASHGPTPTGATVLRF